MEWLFSFIFFSQEAYEGLLSRTLAKLCIYHFIMTLPHSHFIDNREQRLGVSASLSQHSYQR